MPNTSRTIGESCPLTLLLGSTASPPWLVLLLGCDLHPQSYASEGQPWPAAVGIETSPLAIASDTMRSPLELLCPLRLVVQAVACAGGGLQSDGGCGGPERHHRHGHASHVRLQDACTSKAPTGGCPCMRSATASAIIGVGSTSSIAIAHSGSVHVRRLQVQLHPEKPALSRSIDWGRL